MMRSILPERLHLRMITSVLLLEQEGGGGVGVRECNTGSYCRHSFSIVVVSALI